MRFHHLFLLLALSLTLAGCATSPFAKARAAGITTLKVEPRVSLTTPLRYGVAMEGNLSSSLASMIVDSMKAKQITRISEVMLANNIDVREMVHRRFVEALKSRAELPVDDSATGGTFVIAVLQHGYDSGWSMSTEKNAPFLVLEVQLLDANQKKIWSGQSRPIDWDFKALRATWDEFAGQPELLRQNWEKQIDLTIQSVLRAAK